MTNPAIDREREIEHFSCRAVFGARPSIDDPQRRAAHDRDGVPDHPRRPSRHGAALGRGLPAGRQGAQDVPARGPVGGASRGAAACSTSPAWRPRRPRARSSGCSFEAAKKVLDGAELLVLSDRTAFEGERPFLDPHLALSAIDGALRDYRVEPGEENLRRRTSIVLRSAAVRNVHDVCMALGLGADGVCPYVMIEVICVDDYDDRHLEHLLGAAQGNREGDLDARHPRGARLRAPVLGDRPASRSWSRSSTRRATTAPTRPGTGFAELDAEAAERQRDPGRQRGRQARQDVPLLPEGLQGGDRGRQRHDRVRRVLREGARARARAADLDAPHPGPEVRPRADRPRRRSTPASATTTTRS